MDFAYAQDSFHTLTLSEQLGLAGLSALLWGAMLTLCHRFGGVVWAIGLFWAFVWLSPQVYYLYYQVIFEDLPWQVVTKAPPGPIYLVQLLTFQADATLSAHGKGVLGWSFVAITLWGGRRARTHRERSRA